LKKNTGAALPGGGHGPACIRILPENRSGALPRARWQSVLGLGTPLRKFPWRSAGMFVQNPVHPSAPRGRPGSSVTSAKLFGVLQGGSFHSNFGESVLGRSHRKFFGDHFSLRKLRTCNVQCHGAPPFRSREEELSGRRQTRRCKSNKPGSGPQNLLSHRGQLRLCSHSRPPPRLRREPRRPLRGPRSSAKLPRPFSPIIGSGTQIRRPVFPGSMLTIPRCPFAAASKKGRVAGLRSGNSGRRHLPRATATQWRCGRWLRHRSGAFVARPLVATALDVLAPFAKTSIAATSRCPNTARPGHITGENPSGRSSPSLGLGSYSTRSFTAPQTARAPPLHASSSGKSLSQQTYRKSSLVPAVHRSATRPIAPFHSGALA